MLKPIKSLILPSLTKLKNFQTGFVCQNDKVQEIRESLGKFDYYLKPNDYTQINEYRPMLKQENGALYDGEW